MKQKDLKNTKELPFGECLACGVQVLVGDSSGTCRKGIMHLKCLERVSVYFEVKE